MCRTLVHPHVRGADAHEPNGGALQRTTRRRGFPQFWGYGAQATSAEVERTARERPGTVPYLDGIGPRGSMP